MSHAATNWAIQQRGLARKTHVRRWIDDLGRSEDRIIENAT